MEKLGSTIFMRPSVLNSTRSCSQVTRVKCTDLYKHPIKKLARLKAASPISLHLTNESG